MAAPGVEWGELTVAGTGTAWRIRVILVRLDPTKVAFELVRPASKRRGSPGRWSIDDAPRGAVLAMNAGQFKDGPWGWLVRDGAVELPAGAGALAPGIVVDTAGRLRIVPVDSLPTAAAGAKIGFQSYPALLAGGGVPGPLRSPGQGVDLLHREARLALGTTADGRVLVALTRFQGLGGLLETVPFGFTAPEMAALLGALGARDAVLMDGGISSQLLLVDHGRTRTWPGLRAVALGLVVRSLRPAG